MAYLSIAGVSLPPDAYIVSAGFFLPINSAMNPLLYSKFIDQCIARARKCITEKLLVFFQPHADDTTMHDSTGEQIKKSSTQIVSDCTLELREIHTNA